MPSLRFLLPSLLVLATGCAAQLPSTSTQTQTNAAAQIAKPPEHTLIFATADGQLRYWKIDNHGGKTSQLLGTLKGVQNPTAMAANGDTIAVAVTTPPEIVLYDTDTGKQRKLSVLEGSPADIAYDGSGNIVVFNNGGTSGANVTAYTAPKFTATELQCSLLSEYSYIAADREGNIYTNNFLGSGLAIVEIPKGASGYEPQNCKQLPIEESGDGAGLLVDPKTDALVVFHNPDQCAGGNEANMTIYNKPYGFGRSFNRKLGPFCAQMLRFGPDASRVFFAGGYTEARRHNPDYRSGSFVSQRSYPGGNVRKPYQDPDVYTAITTIPNRLPN